MRKLLLLLTCLGWLHLYAQTTLPTNKPNLRIGVLHDGTIATALEKSFHQTVLEEIDQLLRHRYTVEYTDYTGAHEFQRLQENLKTAYSDNDIVIGLGSLASQLVAEQSAFAKPSIASIITNLQLQNIAKTPEGTSGIPNFVYIESPFNISRDLQTLYRVRPYKHLALISSDLVTPREADYFKRLIETNLDKEAVTVKQYNYNSLLSDPNRLDAETDAAYVLPVFGPEGSGVVAQLFDLLNAKKIPSISLFGDTYINRGALLGYQTEQNLSLLPRRIALNVMKIAEGQQAADIPVGIDTYKDNLLINMATARKIGLYPDFNIMADATLVNLQNNDADQQYTLQSVLAQALQSNLDIQLAAKDIPIADTEIGIARSDYLPQADVSTSLSAVDELTALTYQGNQGEINWIGSASVSQVILVEPLLANIAVQKMLKLGEEYELRQTQMDLILDVAEAYLNILRAQTNLAIQQKNVEVTRENFDIAKSKSAIGYAGVTDLYRWEAELATKNIDLNEANASVQQAKYRLNQLLNRPIGEEFSVADETLEDQLLLVADQRTQLVNDYGKLQQFTDFLVAYAKNRLPELDLIDNNIDIQERLKLSNQRAFYLPGISLSGSANRVLAKYQIPEIFEEKDNETTWNIGLGANYPIFQGNLRKKRLQQSNLILDQLAMTRKNISNQLELGIRSNMENIFVSFSRVSLSREAATAATQNFDIVQDAYNQGQVNITTLIDAQNSGLQAELGATNAIYTFILDFLNLERSIGFYYFLASEGERNDFFQALQTHLVSE